MCSLCRNLIVAIILLFWENSRWALWKLSSQSQKWFVLYKLKYLKYIQETASVPSFGPLILSRRSQKLCITSECGMFSDTLTIGSSSKVNAKSLFLYHPLLNLSLRRSTIPPLAHPSSKCTRVCVLDILLWRMSDSPVCVSFSVHLYTFICVWIIYNTRGLLWRRIILL